MGNNHITGNNPVFTTGDNSPITINKKKKKEEEKKISFFDNWIFKSLLIALIVTINLGIAFNSVKIGLIIGTFIFVIIFFKNPQRRFYRVAISCLFIAVGLIAKFSGFIKIPPNNYIQAEIELGGVTNSIIVIIILLISVYLFWLDSKIK